MLRGFLPWLQLARGALQQLCPFKSGITKGYAHLPDEKCSVKIFERFLSRPLDLTLQVIDLIITVDFDLENVTEGLANRQ